MFASVNEEFLVITSERSEKKGCIHVYDIEGNYQYQLDGGYRNAIILRDKILTLKELKQPIPNKD